MELTLDNGDLYRLLKPLLQEHGAVFTDMALESVEIEAPRRELGTSTTAGHKLRRTVKGRVTE